MMPEGFDHVGTQHDLSARFRRLRLDEGPPTPYPLNRKPDSKHSSIEVHVAPAQAEDLTLTHPRRYGEHEEGLEACTPRRLQEGGALLRRQHRRLFSLSTRRLDMVDWVSSQ